MRVCLYVCVYMYMYSYTYMMHLDINKFFIIDTIGVPCQGLYVDKYDRYTYIYLYTHNTCRKKMQQVSCGWRIFLYTCI